MKYIVVTGGVVSGLGKGITISSIGRILKASGVRVTSIKIDPYLNVDAGILHLFIIFITLLLLLLLLIGTMSPFEHGETFVLDDGGETDLDLGNYERFLDITLTGRHNITTGKIYREVIHQERRGDYLGKTVQIVPHATDMIQSWIKDVSKRPVDGTGLEPEVCLIEVGGTVGDIESMVFLEAIRQFQFTVGKENIFFCHVSYVPVLGEQKTKPTQHTVKELRALGLSPDIIVCRCPTLLEESVKRKISIFCHVDTKSVLSVHDVSNIYHVPLILAEQGLHTILKSRLELESMSDTPNLVQWTNMAHVVDTFTSSVDIALVGKYTGLSDSYLSVTKSLLHSGIHLNVHVNVKWIEASDLEHDTELKDKEKFDKAWEIMHSVAGVLVPGGFGNRGVEGKIAAAKYCRESKKPYLGVCLGMQVMVIEFARNVLGIKDANSAEFNENTSDPVIVFMPEISQTEKGGTMRLGARATAISMTHNDKTPTLASEVYGFHVPQNQQKTNNSDESKGYESILGCKVNERHRHRYEVNPTRVDELEEKGLIFSGMDAEGERMEIAEIHRSLHPFYFGTQYHPEFKSRPNRPSPPFFAFVAAASGRSKELGLAGKLWCEHEVELLKNKSIQGPLSPRKRTNSGGTQIDESRSPNLLTFDNKKKAKNT